MFCLKICQRISAILVHFLFKAIRHQNVLLICPIGIQPCQQLEESGPARSRALLERIVRPVITAIGLMHEDRIIL